MLTEEHYRIPIFKILPKFPKLTEFFKKKPEIRKRSRLSQCEVELHKDQCIYRTLPKKQHCLVLKNIISDLIPQYKLALNKTELINYRMLPVIEIFINTCSRKVTFKTSPEATFTLIPNVLHLVSVDAAITVPIPVNDFQLAGGGLWTYAETTLKIKFFKDTKDYYSIKGYSEVEMVAISQIGAMFDIDILPKGGVSALLQNMNLHAMNIKKCKVYGFVQPLRKSYELVFSGEPNVKEFSGGHIRVFITKSGEKKNLAILLELQEYSPVTLLKKIYGPSISRVNVLRDRNQTIALYVSALPTANFSSVFTSHGSSRWIHRESEFNPGAYVLVTLPFPKRKALDMKIQLFPDGLGFSVPESEHLPGDLALGAISPEKITHLGVDNGGPQKNKDDKLYTKIRILKFKYFLFNDTYLAAVESHLSDMEELEELMPIGRPDLISKTKPKFEATSLISHKENKLDAFFRREDIENHDDSRENIKRDLNNSTDDSLSLAEKVGLLK